MRAFALLDVLGEHAIKSASRRIFRSGALAVHNHAEARDIAMEAVVELARRLSSHKIPVQALPRYLIRVVQSMLLRRRREARPTVLIEDRHEGEMVEVSASLVENDETREWLFEFLVKAIEGARLTARGHEVFITLLESDAKHRHQHIKDLASHFGVSESVIRVIYHRARKRVQAEIVEELEKLPTRLQKVLQPYIRRKMPD